MVEDHESTPGAGDKLGQNMREYWERYLEVKGDQMIFGERRVKKKVIWARMWFNFEVFVPMMSPMMNKGRD